MTDEMMTLRTLLEKSSDTDLLREMIGFTAQRLMELEVEGLTGAAHGERSPERINQRNGYRDRPTYVKARESGRIVSAAVIVAVGVNSDGRREVLGMDIGPSEAETFWTEFLRKLARRGLRGVKLVISDAHEGIKAAIGKVLHASWQRCRVHFMRNVLAHAGRQGRRVVAAFIGTAFAQDDAEAASKQWRQVADQLRPKVPKLAALMDEAEADVLAFMSFPKDHRPRSTRSIRWNASTARSSAAPMSSASSPTKMRSRASSAPCCSNRTTNGPFSAVAT